MSPPSTVPRSWTTPADVIAKLRRRWDTGAPLSAYGSGQPWEPQAFWLRGPGATELAAAYERARDWVRSWEMHGSLRVEYAPVGGRALGVNQIPRRAWIDSYEQLWRLLRIDHEVRRFDQLLQRTRDESPRLVDWVLRQPLKALALADDWPRLIRTVTWIDGNAHPRMYLRQIDVPGVDTKFIGRHKAVVAELLDLQLAEGRIDERTLRSDFEGRYGLRRKPTYVRFRYLDGGRSGQRPFSELTARLEELNGAPPQASTVYVIENEITYLALPLVDDAIAILGGGYAVTALTALSWLHDKHLVYWGDLDTHGFAILSRIRASFPHSRSLLMDRGTLIDHEVQWVREPQPTRTHLAHLTGAEGDLYRDLVEDTYGCAVRLEQERVSYGAVERAFASPGEVPGLRLGGGDRRR